MVTKLLVPSLFVFLFRLRFPLKSHLGLSLSSLRLVFQQRLARRRYKTQTTGNNSIRVGYCLASEVYVVGGLLSCAPPAPRWHFLPSGEASLVGSAAPCHFVHIVIPFFF